MSAASGPDQSSPVAVRAAEAGQGEGPAPPLANSFLNEGGKLAAGTVGFLLGVPSALQSSTSVIARVSAQEQFPSQSLQPRGSHRGAFFVTPKKAPAEASVLVTLGLLTNYPPQERKPHDWAVFSWPKSALLAPISDTDRRLVGE